jgi:hypothetical protein
MTVRKKPKRKKIQRHTTQERHLEEADVICGRGFGFVSWPGNSRFRYWCWKLKDIYALVSRSLKPEIAKQVMEEMSLMDSPGRFVELMPGTDLEERRCTLITRERTIEKV